MAATFRTIASGLVTRLAASMTYLNTCRQYAGEIEDVESLVLALDVAPAVFVVFEGMEPDADAEGLADRVYTARYGVVVVAKTMGGAITKAESDTYSAHRMVQDVMDYGADHNLGITGFSGLACGSVRRVKITSAGAVYAVELYGQVVITK